ncbi:MAG: hypothetical protein AUK31_07270 [Fibrobacteres bacterium CG2_30_45_31]|nr:MAG: hypothetical protein AUK31_07270 [Fibrobacteres bacterium CG2_30_45_31]
MGREKSQRDLKFTRKKGVFLEILKTYKNEISFNICIQNRRIYPFFMIGSRPVKRGKFANQDGSNRICNMFIIFASIFYKSIIYLKL